MSKEGHCDRRESMSKGAGVITVETEDKQELASAQQHELENSGVGEKSIQKRCVWKWMS